MVVLSHRGYWKTPEEKNTAEAFRRSFDCGFGAEIDVRDCRGALVVSHDMPKGGELAFTDLLDMLARRPLPLAINVKADGLVAPLVAAMSAANVVDWFVFDMSIPDTRAYLKAGAPVFARVSEVEPEPVWQNEVQGIWLDGFSETWWNAANIEALLRPDRRVCVVSPELHGRPRHPAWEMLQPFRDRSSMMLCTDFPEEARSFFGSLT
jgi:hypothetical protein